MLQGKIFIQRGSGAPKLLYDDKKVKIEAIHVFSLLITAPHTNKDSTEKD